MTKDYKYSRTLFHIILVCVDKALTLFPHHCVFYEGELVGCTEEPSNIILPLGACSQSL